MVAVFTAAEEIKIYGSGSRSVDCSCETFYGTSVLLLVLWLDFFFFCIHVNFSFIAHLNVFI